MSSRVVAISVDAKYSPPLPKEDGSEGEEAPFKVAMIPEGSVVIGSTFLLDEGAPSFELGELPEPAPEGVEGKPNVRERLAAPSKPAEPAPEPVMFETSAGTKMLSEPVNVKKNMDVKMKWSGPPSKPGAGVKGYLLVIPQYG